MGTENLTFFFCNWITFQLRILFLYIYVSGWKVIWNPKQTTQQLCFKIEKNRTFDNCFFPLPPWQQKEKIIETYSFPQKVLVLRTLLFPREKRFFEKFSRSYQLGSIQILGQTAPHSPGEKWLHAILQIQLFFNAAWAPLSCTGISPKCSSSPDFLAVSSTNIISH